MVPTSTCPAHLSDPPPPPPPPPPLTVIPACRSDPGSQSARDLRRRLREAKTQDTDTVVVEKSKTCSKNT
eukprot:758889-Hanusia_phi.AAC.7